MSSADARVNVVVVMVVIVVAAVVVSGSDGVGVGVGAGRCVVAATGAGVIVVVVDSRSFDGRRSSCDRLRSQEVASPTSPFSFSAMSESRVGEIATPRLASRVLVGEKNAISTDFELYFFSHAHHNKVNTLSFEHCFKCCQSFIIILSVLLCFCFLR